jgi:thiamine transport system ATP-binding protein
MLEVVNVTVRFGPVTALDDVSLKLESGQTMALLGPSGAGKSTLLRVIGGLQPPDAGEVRWDGVPLGLRAPHTRGFGLMFQDYALFPHLDVAHNVGFGLAMTGVPDETADLRVTEMLEMVGLGGYEARSIHTLSGGEQQRVALARALAPNPRLLMLDEPIGALDRNLRGHLLGELHETLRALGTPTIYVTHDQEEAFEIADQVAVMEQGSLLQVDTPEQIWRRPASLAVARFLGHDNIVEVRAQGEVIATPWGAIEGFLPEGTHLVSVPTTALRVGPPGDISATVVASRFADGRHRVELKALNQPITAEMTGPRPEPGSTVELAIDATRLIQIPRSEITGEG